MQPSPSITPGSHPIDLVERLSVRADLRARLDRLKGAVVQAEVGLEMREDEGVNE